MARPACLLLLLSLLLSIGCAGSKEGGEDQGERRERRRMDRTPVDGYVSMRLAPPDDAVRTIQLYREADERALPLLTLDTDVTLTLEFDLLTDRGRPLSVYFYHADRDWNRDLIPAEYMSAFHYDNLYDYRASLATDQRYVHYTYRFPTQGTGFRISGNYILRVTEQGQEDAVLFEQPFFVTEQTIPLDLGVDRVMVPGQGFSAIQPIALFTPPQALQGNIFGYQVCFVRNGRFAGARCSDTPGLNQQPEMRYYLQPQSAFAPEPADYLLDLSVLQIGPRIQRTDLTHSPYQAWLEPDDARFGGLDTDPLLNGQAVIDAAVRDVNEPDVRGEYVRVHFTYIPPDEQRLSGRVLVTGSFNGWYEDPDNELLWIPELGRYEGTVLIKQGQYEYRYVLTSPEARALLRTPLPRPDNLYLAFVYYRDVSLNTDRILGVDGLLTP